MPITFPERPFLWGTALSHYQVEGDDPCDWTAWEADGRTRGAPCAGAVDGWARYESDADLAKWAGANAFRFSISWSRVEPRPGEFDEKALERYRRLVDHLARIGLEPVVSLFHYTHPRWFVDHSPWTSPASVGLFARFAARVAAALGRSVRIWTIFNEPLVFLLGGYIDGQIPPGIRDTRLAGLALANILSAHVAARAAIRETNAEAAIGVAHNFMGFAPERAGHPLDRLLARVADRFYNRAFLDSFLTGRWDLYLPPFTRIRGQVAGLAGSLDFVGVNFYSRLHLRCPGRERFVGDFRYLDRAGLGFTDNGWEIVPESFREALATASALGLPILVTENGLADGADSRRGAYLENHAAVVAEAMGAGLPVHGYLYWSLLDNFEWLEGWGPKFGLFEVDRETMERRPRPSVETFRRLGESFLTRA